MCERRARIVKCPVCSFAEMVNMGFYYECHHRNNDNTFCDGRSPARRSEDKQAFEKQVDKEERELEHKKLVDKQKDWA